MVLSLRLRPRSGLRQRGRIISFLLSARLKVGGGCGCCAKRRYGEGCRYYFVAPTVRVVAPAAVAFAALICLAPVHISCIPRNNVITVITALSLIEGTLLVNAHPSSTPGMPPSSKPFNNGPLIEPRPTWKTEPVPARTIPKRMSVPTTCAAGMSEQLKSSNVPKAPAPADENPVSTPMGSVTQGSHGPLSRRATW